MDCTVYVPLNTLLH